MISRLENVNGYHILYARNIGSGSLGSVYLCQKNGKQWAVKIISKQKLDKDPRQLERFQDEVSIGMEDNGKNVIKIVGLGEDLHNWYIFMNLCLEKLNKLFQKKVQLSEEKAVAILMQILKGYKILASKKIMHRDLTPFNILLSQNGEYLISDLGLCKQNFLKSFIHQGSTISTPKYQSIQHFTSNYSSKCDVWSISLIFYQLLHTGKFPYIFNNIYELHERIKHQKIEIRQNISKQTIDFLKKGLQPYEKDRMSVRNMLKHPLFKDMLFTVEQKLAQEVLIWLAQLIKKKQLDIFEILEKLKLSSEEWLNSLQIQQLLKYLLDSSIDNHQIETFFKVYKMQQKNAIHRTVLIDEIFRLL